MVENLIGTEDVTKVDPRAKIAEEIIGFVPHETTPSVRARTVETLLASYNKFSKIEFQLNLVSESTIEKARLEEKNGNWESAACNFYSVWENKELELSIRGEAIANLAQMFINHGEFGRARGFLSELEKENPKDKYLHARINEKLGWIADYEGEFGVARENFLTARHLVEHPQTEGEKNLFSTTTHFLGRASVGLALGQKGEEREKTLMEAVSYFQKDLEYNLAFREAGDPHLDNEAYQYLWMARCYIHFGNKEEDANNCIKKAEELINESVAKDSNSEGMLGHLNNVKGAYALALKDPEWAFYYFQEALNIRLKIDDKNEGKGKFTKGEAESLIGMAVSKFGSGKLGETFIYLKGAFKTYPLLVLRGTV